MKAEPTSPIPSLTSRSESLVTSPAASHALALGASMWAQFSYINVPFLKQHEGYFGADIVILNHGQMTRRAPGLAPLLQTSTQHQREGVWPLRMI
ncbi:hypothetical protein AVEN_186144-1 [Araneus ventricosus]|uniref:Uncharacterized protein n=1 Tax=Araneus ventricosus TaxID=182803 RepID=A0A4Y2DSQ4_ARAVE|nr:hypothetical protein AVEN_186144-1 [Araneus ventricosus]